MLSIIFSILISISDINYYILLNGYEFFRTFLLVDKYLCWLSDDSQGCVLQSLTHKYYSSWVIGQI